MIREEQRQGFVRAANKGFRAAAGRNMIWLNDDAWLCREHWTKRCGRLICLRRKSRFWRCFIGLPRNVIRPLKSFTKGGLFVCAMSAERFMRISRLGGGRRIDSLDILTSGFILRG